MAGPVDIQWSVDALEDLQRFADFLHERYPGLAGRVAGELIARTNLLRRHPHMGRPVGQSRVYRELVLAVLGGMYSVQYRFDGQVVLVLRILHRPRTALIEASRLRAVDTDSVITPGLAWPCIGHRRTVTALA